jgi:hypothetical protein
MPDLYLGKAVSSDDRDGLAFHASLCPDLSARATAATLTLAPGFTNEGASGWCPGSSGWLLLSEIRVPKQKRTPGATGR